MYELVYNDRVIGGIDEISTQKAISFYSKYVKKENYTQPMHVQLKCVSW